MNGAVVTTFETGEAAIGGLAEIDDSALTFLFRFATADQSNDAVIAPAVETFPLSSGAPGSYGMTETAYLGLQERSGLPGTSGQTLSDGGLSGTWTRNQSAIGDAGSFGAIQVGGSQTDPLYDIAAPGTIDIVAPGTSDIGDILIPGENIAGDGNYVALPRFDVFESGSSSVPEPGAMAILTAGLLALVAFRRRKTLYGARPQSSARRRANYYYLITTT